MLRLCFTRHPSGSSLTCLASYGELFSSFYDQPPTVDGENNDAFHPGPSVPCLAIRCPAVKHVVRVMRYLRTQWKDFSENWHKYSSCESELLQRFSRSEVNVTARPNAVFQLRTTHQLMAVRPVSHDMYCICHMVEFTRLNISLLLLCISIQGKRIYSKTLGEVKFR